VLVLAKRAFLRQVTRRRQMRHQLRWKEAA
jgi:hypothetical protein